MKIAIDLNDVIRDYSNNFLKNYLLNYNREFDTSDFSFWTNEMQNLLIFKTDREYERFVYEDYSYELFGKNDTCERNTITDLKKFSEEIYDINNKNTIMFVSPMEIGPSIGYTYFFISKLGSDIREVYLPKDSFTIWDKCDVLITANPRLLDSKPEGKKSVKINFEYNNDCEADFTFNSFSEIANNENNIKKILNNE